MNAFFRSSSRGFTLIEVLVALAIVAVALSAGMRTITQSAVNANMLKHRTLALWVAENQIAALQLSDELPPAGTQSGSATQDGIEFTWRQTITTTPNPAFRKVDIRVVDSDDPDYELARLNSYVGVAVKAQTEEP